MTRVSIERCYGTKSKVLRFCPFVSREQSVGMTAWKLCSQQCAEQHRRYAACAGGSEEGRESF